jgi:hypothetical protein
MFAGWPGFVIHALCGTARRLPSSIECPMSLPDENLPFASFVQEEMVDCLAKALTSVVGQLTPVARLRLLAFMHLIEDPEALKASLEIEPSGYLRLTLDAFVSPCQGHQH